MAAAALLTMGAGLSLGVRPNRLRIRPGTKARAGVIVLSLLTLMGVTRLADRTELFPEPRAARTDLLAGTNLEGHNFNDFFPWAINEDGTSEETLNHLGRHELHGYFNRSMNDDPKANQGRGPSPLHAGSNQVLLTCSCSLT